MAKMQKLPKSSVTTSGSSYGSCKPEVASDQFPAGLRVLVVDDDAAWLKIVEKMLRRCMYKGKFHLVTCLPETELCSFYIGCFLSLIFLFHYSPCFSICSVNRRFFYGIMLSLVHKICPCLILG